MIPAMKICCTESARIQLDKWCHRRSPHLLNNWITILEIMKWTASAPAKSVNAYASTTDWNRDVQAASLFSRDWWEEDSVKGHFSEHKKEDIHVWNVYLTSYKCLTLHLKCSHERASLQWASSNSTKGWHLLSYLINYSFYNFLHNCYFTIQPTCSRVFHRCAPEVQYYLREYMLCLLTAVARGSFA